MKNALTRRTVFASLLFAGVATKAISGVHEPFGVGYANPSELARTVRESSKTDPLGKLPVNSTRCLANGYSCASAQQYVAGFKLADPIGARDLTVAGLPDYLERLVEGQPDGEFWMSCLTNNREALWNCMSRPLDLTKGERAWKNPKTGRFVLAGKCTNPMGELVHPPECLYIDYYLKVNDEVHIVLLGPDPLPKTACLAIQRLGETEWRNVLLDECPRAVCTYDGPVSDLKLALQPGLRVSYKAEKEGWHKLRLPHMLLTSEDQVLLCVIKPDGTQSLSKPIARRHYHHVDGRMVAFVGYSNYPSSTPPNGGFLHKWEWSSVRLAKE